MAPTFSDRPPPASRVLGSNAEAVTIGQQAKATTVSIAAAGAPSLKAMAVGSAPSQRYFLNLEGIRGAAPSGVLTVTVGTEGGTAHPADTVALFGLANASRGDGPHAGNGLGATIDITQAVGDILAAGGNLNALKIGIEQPDAAPGREITVGRVSVVAQDGD